MVRHPAPTKSTVAKTKLSSTTKKPESEPRAAEDEAEPAAPKRTAVPSKLGIGVVGNVLAKMKARNIQSSEKPEPSKACSLSQNPLRGIRLRPTPHTPEDQEPPKLPKGESERNKSANPLTGFRLHHRDEAEEAKMAKLEEKLNLTVYLDDLPSTDPTSDAKANPPSGVPLCSTGINVTDPLKSPHNGDSSAEIKKDTDISDVAKENDAKEAVKQSKVRAMAASVNFYHSNSVSLLQPSPFSNRMDFQLSSRSESKDGAAVEQVDGQDSPRSIGFLNQLATLPQQQQQPLISQ
ncbi:hypothetical protein DAPPUDRAFT_247994 [Daphnia pulex]|nr:hypothetical protein DAPPUDRAFT_247994 [Daphnia pulex]|eukprot:EFX77216.1 hypothetical protein DAPPUDRAFT_247994 [Daphnia pulex]